VNDDDKSEKTYQHIKKHVVAKAKKHELKWVAMFTDNFESWNDKKYSFDSLKDNESEIDIIIFKTSIATGWDIPRATSLLQFRNVVSKSFDTQVVGRVRRKAVRGSRDKVFDKYFVYRTNTKDNKS
jgi:superfamily II DNA or RNA helicase